MGALILSRGWSVVAAESGCRRECRTNGDGVYDIVAAAANDMVVLANLGDGTFAPPLRLTGTTPVDLGVADSPVMTRPSSWWRCVQAA